MSNRPAKTLTGFMMLLAGILMVAVAVWVGYLANSNNNTALRVLSPVLFTSSMPIFVVVFRQHYPGI